MQDFYELPCGCYKKAGIAKVWCATHKAYPSCLASKRNFKRLERGRARAEQKRRPREPEPQISDWE